ncbi:MAG: DUF294 nucleotidyltransferase-like domain-containing protein [Bacteroidales bacterium]|nr:DUF294 nucleotidyltransferase-like domain-containing protein [Bacteroidales bacterium]
MELSSRSNVNLDFESSPGSKGKFLVLDTETTGLLPKEQLEDTDPETHPRVIQVAWLLFDADGKLIESHNRYILQEQPVPPSSTQIHGIEDATLLQKGEKPTVVWNDFLTALEQCDYLIAHNIDFDLPVIESELRRLHIHNPFAGKRKFCTMKLGRIFCKIPADDGNGYRFPALDELYKICFFGRLSDLQISGLHDAYVDAAVTSKVFFQLFTSLPINLEAATEEPFKLPFVGTSDSVGKGKFFLHIILPTFLTILLFFLTIFLIIIPRFKENIMLGKRQMIEELTRSAASILDKYETDERNGLMTREEAQNTAISRIQYLRYGTENKDYFWITDLKPNMIMHPYRSDLNGKSLQDFTDPHGKKLFVEMVSVCNKNGHGYVEYMWQWKDDPAHIVPKLSYVAAFKPWGWIIGTGIYVEDVKKEIVSLTQRLLVISLGISLIIALLLTYITYHSIRIERKRKSAESQLRISREKYKTLVDATTEGLIMMLDHKMIFSNNKALELTGFDENELNSHPFSKLISDKNNPETLRIFKHRNLPDGQYELILSLKNGSTLDTIVTISSMFFSGKKGKLITIKDASVHQTSYGTIEDILQILELSGLGFIRFLLDSKGKIIYSSKAMVSILGFADAKELSNYSILDFFFDSAEKKKYRTRLLADGRINNVTIRLKRRDGGVRVVSASMVIKKDESQQLLCDGIIEDITKRTTEIQEKNEFITQLQVHSLLLHNSVDSFIVPFNEVQMDISAAGIIKIMKNNHTDVVLVSNRDGAKVGIVTAGDIVERILLSGSDPKRPVYEIMSAPLVFVNTSDTLSKAITTMQTVGISHLVARHATGSIAGMIHKRDISHSMFNSFSFIENEIDSAQSVGELSILYQRFLSYLSLMIGQTVNPVIIGKSIASISGRITGKLIAMAMAEIGEPPVEFAFIAMGSEGRMEQTLVTDQDNAIVYQDVPDIEADQVQAWFNNLGEIVCDQLNAVGFRYCKGRIMAKNPLWCKPLQTWKNYFSQWISTPEPKNLMDVSIFFDLRPVFGSAHIINELRSHIDIVSDGRSSFFYNLAESVLSFKPSMGITGAIHTEKRDNKELFDLKNAVTPYIMFARIYAIFHKIPAANTIGRIQALYALQVIPLATCRDVSFGYDFLMMLRYKHQVARLESSGEINNLIDLNELPEVEETVLKKTLSLVSDFQNRLNIDFKRSIL